MSKRRVFVLMLLVLALPLIVFISMSVGVLPVSPLGLILASLSPNHEVNPVAWAVIWYLRLPRALMAVMAGAVLAIAGVVLQGSLRNPLVSPFTLGVSSGASFGAALAIVLGVGIVGMGAYLIMANAFVFALLATFITLGIARLRGMTAESVILAGIAVMYMFSAGVTLLQYVAREWELTELVYWLMGDLSKASWHRLRYTVLAVIVCIPLFKFAWDLNVLMMGDDAAKSLGTDPSMTRVACACLSALAVSIVVCMTGPIGFIGLMAPHLARLVVGSDHRFLMPTSALIGALLLSTADLVARTIMMPLELPVGVVTAFFGVPLFVHLLLRTRREIWR